MDTIHTHSHGHKDSVADPVAFVNESFIMCCVEDAIKGLSGSAKLGSDFFCI